MAITNSEQIIEVLAIMEGQAKAFVHHGTAMLTEVQRIRHLIETHAPAQRAVATETIAAIVASREAYYISHKGS